MTATTYTKGDVKLPPLNDIEVDFISTALATAKAEGERRADECEAGRRRHWQNLADQYSRIGRKMAFPDQPKQW